VSREHAVDGALDHRRHERQPGRDLDPFADDDRVLAAAPAAPGTGR
jgi:hypothetical protein